MNTDIHNHLLLSPSNSFSPFSFSSSLPPTYVSYFFVHVFCREPQPLCVYDSTGYVTRLLSSSRTQSLYTSFLVMVLWSWKEWYKYPIEGYREIIFSLAFQNVAKDFLNLFSFLLLSFLIIVFIIIFRYHYLNQTNGNILRYQGQ